MKVQTEQSKFDTDEHTPAAQSGIRHYAERSGAPEAPDDQ